MTHQPSTPKHQSSDKHFLKTGRQLGSLSMELYHVNQWADQAQREKSWLFGELDMRNMIVQGDRAKKKKRQ